MASLTQTMGPTPIYRDVQPHMHRARPGTSKQHFIQDLSQCLFDFVIQLLPTQEEMAVKEDVRKLLERLIRTIEPDSRLLSFGSTANGFSLRNSDMDLCCLIDSDERLAATDLVTMLGDLLERETKFHVKPLPHARIPIVKLSLDPSPGLPLGIACDIGFENRLALENTRLLMCYAMIDPTRVRTLVLFLKVWSKRRKINSPYKGTLSSYGYVLLVIYFLVHVKNPPVLPNLQQMPPLRPISKEDTHMNGHNVWFFDDIELLRQRWVSENRESVAELLIDFFRYYSRDFSYNTGVASIRAGLLKKESKGWQNDLSPGRYNDARERNRFCIEDPFETDFNVARCVTRDGLYTIRGEFMRAVRILAARPERAILALSELCEERKDEELVSALSHSAARPTLPPQTPYNVGSHPMRPKGAPPADRFSPPSKAAEPGPRLNAAAHPQVPSRSPPEHMAPKRAKWTSPPPPEAAQAEHNLFESQLNTVLELATASTEAREKEDASSSSASEIFSDEERSDVGDADDISSVRSYTEGSGSSPVQFRRPASWLMNGMPLRFTRPQVEVTMDTAAGMIPGPRGRPAKHVPSVRSPVPPPASSSSNSGGQFSKRSISGPPRQFWHVPLAASVPLPPSPETQYPDPSTSMMAVFYETPQASRYPPQSSLFTMQPPPQYAVSPLGIAGPDTPTPEKSHGHSHSATTIVAPSTSTPPPPPQSKPATPSSQDSSSCRRGRQSSPLTTRKPFSGARSQSRSRFRSPSPSTFRFPRVDPGSPMSPSLIRHFEQISLSPNASFSASASTGSSPMSSSTGYATSISRSPSPAKDAVTGRADFVEGLKLEGLGEIDAPPVPPPGFADEDPTPKVEDVDGLAKS